MCIGLRDAACFWVSSSAGATPHLRSGPCSKMSVPPKREHILCGNRLPTKGVQVPPLRETTMPSVQTLVRDVDLFLSLGSWFFPWSTLDKPNLTISDTEILLTVTSCIINTIFQFFSGTQARRAGTPPISSQRLAEGFMRFFFKKPVITSPTLRTLATRTSPSCSTGTPSSLTLRFSPSRKTPQAKVPGVRSYSSSEVCCDALHFPKKRDASTDLVRRPHGYRKQHNVDFIGGDFNMSSFSTASDVFSDPEFSAPGTSFSVRIRCAGKPGSRVHWVSNHAKAST